MDHVFSNRHKANDQKCQRKNNYVDLANSVSDPQVEVGLLDDVNQRALWVSPGRRRHGVVGPQHRHLQTTTTTQLKTLTKRRLLLPSLNLFL